MLRLKQIFNGHTNVVLVVVFAAGGLYWQVQNLQQKMADLTAEVKDLRTEVTLMRFDYSSTQRDAAVIQERIAQQDSSVNRRLGELESRVSDLSRNAVRWSHEKIGGGK